VSSGEASSPRPPVVGGFVLADDILSRSAADIVALYRSKRISPVEVVTATLDRIDRLDRLYNAFVMIDREGALRDARASEERWRQHRLARQARLSYLPCASSPSILAVVFLISTTSNRVSSNQSLRCRETEFLGQRQRGRNSLEGSRMPLQRQNLAKQARQFGASLGELGNLR
jgi:hypothetical protein